MASPCPRSHFASPTPLYRSAFATSHDGRGWPGWRRFKNFQYLFRWRQRSRWVQGRDSMEFIDVWGDSNPAEAHGVIGVFKQLRSGLKGDRNFTKASRICLIDWSVWFFRHSEMTQLHTQTRHPRYANSGSVRTLLLEDSHYPRWTARSPFQFPFRSETVRPWCRNLAPYLVHGAWAWMWTAVARWTCESSARWVFPACPAYDFRSCCTKKDSFHTLDQVHWLGPPKAWICGQHSHPLAFVGGRKLRRKIWRCHPTAAAG